MEAYNLIFNDGSIVVDASFLETRSKVVREMSESMNFPKGALIPLELPKFSRRDWEDYCANPSDLKVFHLIDYLDLETSGLVETVTKQLSDEVIYQRVKETSLDELASHLSFLTELNLDYGEKTLNQVVDLLSRSDEILETNRSYIQVPIPDNFYDRLRIFLDGIDWKPTPGVILSGGALMTLLIDRDLSTVETTEDLDLWIYGPDEETKKTLQRDLTLRLTENKRVKGVWDPSERKITLTYQDHKRPIQIIRSEYSVPSQIPNFFDLDHLKGYLSVDGLFLHPRFIRALKFNYLTLDLETIKVRRILKSLRYDYTVNRVPLWEEVVKFLKSKTTSPLLGRVPHLPTKYNLSRLKKELGSAPIEIKSKEELISFLKEIPNPPIYHEHQVRELTGLPENCRWKIEQSSEDDYPLSIREKSLIISLQDPSEIQEALLERSREINLIYDGRDCHGSEIYWLTQPIILRFHGLIIREWQGRYFCSFAKGDGSTDADNPRSEFLEEISRSLESVSGSIQSRRTMPLLSGGGIRNSIGLRLDLLETTGLSGYMKVDLDLQIDGVFAQSFMKCVRKSVTYMKILEHL